MDVLGSGGPAGQIATAAVAHVLNTVLNTATALAPRTVTALVVMPAGPERASGNVSPAETAPEGLFATMGCALPLLFDV